MLTFQRRNANKCCINCVREKVQTADFPFVKYRLDIRPHFLDGVEIWTIGWKIQQSYTFRFQNFPDGLYMVRAHTVHHNDVA